MDITYKQKIFNTNLLINRTLSGNITNIDKLQIIHKRI